MPAFFVSAPRALSSRKLSPGTLPGLFLPARQLNRAFWGEIDCPGSTPAARITRALASSPAHPHRSGRVRRVRAHGGGPLPARLRPHPATLRWRVGAWQPSLAGRAAADRSCDPCPATCDGSSVSARRADAGRGVTPVPDRTTGGWYGCDSGSGLHRSRAQTVALSVPIRYAGAETYRLRCRR